jgi:hypothetical protein
MYAAHTLSLDSTMVYWGEGRHYFVGRIAKAPISGGQPTTVLGGIGRGTNSLFTVGDAGVFVVDGEVLKKISIDGGPLVETVYWKLGFNIPWRPVTDGGFAYFITRHSELLKVPVSGGGADTLANEPARMSGPVAVGNSMVFWVNQPLPTEPFSIMRTPTSAGATVPFVTGFTGFVSDMLVDSNALYWIEVGSSAIRKMAFTGGPVITLWPGSANEGLPKITQDDTFLYWINETQVGRVPKSGGQASFYQLLRDHRFAIGVDDTSVYWVTDVALMRATPK